jgi:hypothetical protein
MHQRKGWDHLHGVVLAPVAADPPPASLQGTCVNVPWNQWRAASWRERPAAGLAQNVRRTPYSLHSERGITVLLGAMNPAGWAKVEALAMLPLKSLP